ncbi:hypothetical protein, partial [uncultured Winogradskyella sp.]|uniref:hypothetical protein n=1 Tax=uncultured Winogradskyella sp. TaxID=395353 RepID=UPI002612DC06
MKHPYIKFLPSLIMLFFTIVFYAQSDIYESYAILDINGNGNTYFDLNATTANTDFDGANLGTFNPGNSLILNGAQNQTYKCSTHNIMNGYIDYRVYLSAATPGAFIPSEILFNSDDGTSNYCGNTSTDQTWESMGANIDILNGLTSGDYILEVYVRADVDYNNDNILDNTLYNSNSGLNFRANFRVDNPPVANCNTTLTVQLDAFGNATITAADIDNNSTDDFDTPTLTIDVNTFDCSDIGTPITVTLTAEDTLGQTDTCTTLITVEDNVNPVTPTLAPVTVDCNGTLTAPTTTDACAGTITGTTSDTLSFVEGGSTTITWTFNDGNGNAITANQVYNYDDTTNPVTPTLAPVTVDCNGTLTAPTTTDACA